MNIDRKIWTLYSVGEERCDTEETKVKRLRRKLLGKTRFPLAIMYLLKLLLEVDLDTNACERVNPSAAQSYLSARPRRSRKFRCLRKYRAPRILYFVLNFVNQFAL